MQLCHLHSSKATNKKATPHACTPQKPAGNVAHLEQCVNAKK